MRLLVTVFSVAATVVLVGCKKNSPPPSLPNNNEVNATVVLSSGQIITINARGTKAPMGLSSPLGGSSYVDGTNDAGNAVYINIFPIISGPGTFDFAGGFRCQYRINAGSGATPIYENNGANAGSITFTTANAQMMEGSFNAVCRYGTDSVLVAGTFKGDRIGQ